MEKLYYTVKSDNSLIPSLHFGLACGDGKIRTGHFPVPEFRLTFNGIGLDRSHFPLFWVWGTLNHLTSKTDWEGHWFYLDFRIEGAHTQYMFIKSIRYEDPYKCLTYLV